MSQPQSQRLLVWWTTIQIDMQNRLHFEGLLALWGKRRYPGFVILFVALGCDSVMKMSSPTVMHALIPSMNLTAPSFGRAAFAIRTISAPAESSHMASSRSSMCNPHGLRYNISEPLQIWFGVRQASWEKVPWIHSIPILTKSKGFSSDGL